MYNIDGGYLEVGKKCTKTLICSKKIKNSKDNEGFCRANTLKQLYFYLFIII